MLPRFCAFLFSALLPTFCIAADKTVYGVSENVLVEDFGLNVKAKLDTGAQTASLSARDVKLIEREGKQWVRFSLAIDGASSQQFERPVVRTSRIKRRSGDIESSDKQTYTARPVIELSVCLGKARHTIEVNLTDRSQFQYPLLLGTSALKRFEALVDPSAANLAGAPACLPQSRGTDD